MSSTLRIQVVNCIDEETILPTLNRELADVTERIERFLACNGQVSSKERQRWFQDEVAGYLRVPVDQWLRTGVNSYGRESPRSRQLRREYAMQGFFQYIAMHPPAVRFEGRGLTVVIGEMPDMPAGWNEFFQNAATEAHRLFAGLMLSEWRFGLCKCRYCEKYFLHPKPRASYVHGTFCCAAHGRHESAGRLSAKDRERAKFGREKVAAEYLISKGVTTTVWQKDADLKHRLAAAVSIQMAKHPRLQSGREQVGLRWVSRNQEQIEAKRRELARASKTG
jgi:hypothetical protein